MNLQRTRLLKVFWGAGEGTRVWACHYREILRLNSVDLRWGMADPADRKIVS